MIMFVYLVVYSVSRFLVTKEYKRCTVGTYLLIGTASVATTTSKMNRPKFINKDAFLER